MLDDAIMTSPITAVKKLRAGLQMDWARNYYVWLHGHLFEIAGNMDGSINGIIAQAEAEIVQQGLATRGDLKALQQEIDLRKVDSFFHAVTYLQGLA